MIREGESPDDLVPVRQIAAERRILGDAGEEDRHFRIDISQVALLRIDRFERAVIDRREQDRHLFPLTAGPFAGLRIEVLDAKRLEPFDPLPILQVDRAFGDDDNVGGEQALRQVAQPAERQKFILVDRTVPVDQHDVEGGLEGPVLERVVQDDHIGRAEFLVLALAGFLGGLEFFRMGQETASLDAVLVHGDGYAGKLLLDLQRFVAIEISGAAAVDLLESLAAALVSAGQHGDLPHPPVIAAQQGLQDHLRMRGLASSAGGDVTHADRGDIGAVRFADTFIIKRMPDLECQVIGSEENLF